MFADHKRHEPQEMWILFKCVGREVVWTLREFAHNGFAGKSPLERRALRQQRSNVPPAAIDERVIEVKAIGVLH